MLTYNYRPCIVMILSCHPERTAGRPRLFFPQNQVLLRCSGRLQMQKFHFPPEIKLHLEEMASRLQNMMGAELLQEQRARQKFEEPAKTVRRLVQRRVSGTSGGGGARLPDSMYSYDDTRYADDTSGLLFSTVLRLKRNLPCGFMRNMAKKAVVKFSQEAGWPVAYQWELLADDCSTSTADE